MSKVAVPQKEIVEFETEIEVHREVPSVIKVKPRVLPPPNNQANKNLLLKAVAEAQRSIAQTPVVGTNSKVSLIRNQTTMHLRYSKIEKYIKIGSL